MSDFLCLCYSIIFLLLTYFNTKLMGNSCFFLLQICFWNFCKKKKTLSELEFYGMLHCWADATELISQHFRKTNFMRIFRRSLLNPFWFSWPTNHIFPWHFFFSKIQLNKYEIWNATTPWACCSWSFISHIINSHEITAHPYHKQYLFSIYLSSYGYFTRYN